VEADVYWLDLLGIAAGTAVLAGFCMNAIRQSSDMHSFASAQASHALKLSIPAHK
jgi:fructose-1-phosphate kinase PfkB-like protein